MRPYDYGPVWGLQEGCTIEMAVRDLYVAGKGPVRVRDCKGLVRAARGLYGGLYGAYTGSLVACSGLYLDCMRVVWDRPGPARR